jgi:hypothetical protein
MMVKILEVKSLSDMGSGVTRPYVVTIMIDGFHEEKVFEIEDVSIGEGTISLCMCDEKFWWQFADGTIFASRICEVLRSIDRGDSVIFPIVLKL